MKHQLLAAAALTFVVLATGCSDGAKPEVATTSEASKPAPVKPAATPEDWQLALEKSQVISQLKTEEEGITTWFACFQESASGDGSSKKRCQNFSFAKRDAFRKTRFFKSGLNSQIPSSVPGWNYVVSYISLSDNALPKLILSPRYFSKGGWLFMSQVSILADGELVFDRSFPKLEVDRESESYGVEESIHLVMSQAEIESLRKLASAKALSVRLTGDKGYVALKQDAVKGFKEEIANILVIHDKLHTNLKAVIPPTAASS